MHLDDVIPVNLAHCGGLTLYSVSGAPDGDPGPLLVQAMLFENGPIATDPNPNNDHHGLVVDLDSAGVLYAYPFLRDVPTGGKSWKLQRLHRF